MTTINLPAVQPNAKPAPGKNPSAGNGAEENGSFHDVLASKVDKAKPGSREPARDQPAAETGSKTKPVAGKDQDVHKDSEDRKDRVGKDAAVAEQALPLIAGLPDANPVFIGVAPQASVAATHTATAPALPQAGRAQRADITGLQTEAQPKSVKGQAVDIVDAGQARKTSQARQEGVVAKDQPAQRQPLAAAPDVAAATGRNAADEVAAPDFAKLLVGREAAAPAMPPVAAMQTAAANANTAMMANVIEPRLGSKDWSQAVSQKVVWMVGAMEQSATLTLNPPDLGPLQVVIQVHNDQADAAFMSDNPDVRQALQDSLGTLRNMMSNSGIQLGDASISAGGSGQEQLQQQFQQSQRQTANGRQTDSAQQRHLETPVARQGGGSSLVDTFA